MAQLIGRDVTIPAGTTQAAPLVTDISFPPALVESIRVRVPPGPNGLMGFRVTSGGIPVIPLSGVDWVIANDESFDWRIDGLIDSGAFELTGYNSGVHDHTVYLQFILAPPLAAAAPAILPAAAISHTGG